MSNFFEHPSWCPWCRTVTASRRTAPAGVFKRHLRAPIFRSSTTSFTTERDWRNICHTHHHFFATLSCVVQKQSAYRCPCSTLDCSPLCFLPPLCFAPRRMEKTSASRRGVEDRSPRWLCGAVCFSPLAGHDGGNGGSRGDLSRLGREEGGWTSLLVARCSLTERRSIAHPVVDACQNVLVFGPLRYMSSIPTVEILSLKLLQRLCIFADEQFSDESYQGRRRG